MRWIIVIYAAASILSNSQAIAESFYCTKAPAPGRHIICFNSTLSQADTKLNAVYVASLQRLSHQGGNQLRNDQRNWLRFLSDACPVTSSAEEQTRIEAVTCLTRAYADRMRDFEQIAIRKGPFLFTRIDEYSVTHLKTKANEYDTGLAIHKASYPRIDSPVNRTTIQWNQRQVQRGMDAGCDSADGDTSKDYRLGLVNAHLISVTKFNWTYCHGTPHGFGGSTIETLVLMPLPHVLQPSDLFRTGVPWQKRLNDLALQSIRETSLSEHYSLEHLDDAAVASIAADPARWNLRQDGLALISNPYELGLGYATHLDVTIPWSKIRDLMVRRPPVP